MATLAVFALLLVFVCLADGLCASKPIILYDGVCRFCNMWVDLVLKMDTEGDIKFAALQSDVGRDLLAAVGRKPDDLSSIVFVETGGQHFVKSEAVVQVARRLGLPIIPLASKFLPLGLKDALYDAIAENRYRLMGQLDSCRLRDPSYDERFLS